MKLLLFEWLWGGGLWFDNAACDPTCPIQRQGGQMLQVVLDDFLSLGIEVVVPLDSRLIDQIPKRTGLGLAPIEKEDGLPEIMASMANEVDHIMIVAPECDSTLARCLTWVEPNRDKLISPGKAFAELTSNKPALFEFLKEKGFLRYPEGMSLSHFLESGDVGSGKYVVKPVDGAGSDEIKVVPPTQFDDLMALEPSRFFVEEFVPGTAASVSVIECGDQRKVLTPTRQLFDQHPIGHYVGASNLNPDLQERTMNLAEEVLMHLPKTQGYFGMDIVLHGSGDPARDCLIEINPRLTMSYLFLRDLANENLASLMIPNSS